jgi:hypothetical protein
MKYKETKSIKMMMKIIIARRVGQMVVHIYS